MSAGILLFTPSAERLGHQNLLALIEACRRSTVLGASTQFDLDIWEDGYLKGSSGKHRIVFNTYEAARLRKPQPTPALPEPFLSFAKPPGMSIPASRSLSTPA